jgi:2EXR family
LSIPLTEFTLFPKLPAELRVKIWKNALPGPRVIPLCISYDVFDSTVHQCRSTSGLIIIRLACHEALDVVQKSYDKYVPVLMSQSDFIQDDDGQQAFIYINYDIDTIYLHKWEQFEQMQKQCLGKAKHLAWRGCELMAHSFTWIVLRAACPLMQIFTMVALQNQDFRYHFQEWRLVNMPIDFETSMVLPQWVGGGWDDQQLADALDDYGVLALACAEAQHVRTEFDEYAKQHACWENVSFQVAVLGTRDIGARSWSLPYFIPDPCLEDDIDHHLAYSSTHWHDEPVNIGQGGLVSCEPHENARKRQLCRICRKQR